MIRVVLDTNILISALLSPSGPPAQVFLRAILDSEIQLCVSGEIYAEYEEVMRRLGCAGLKAKFRMRFEWFATELYG